jgi:hypothetical protein
MGRKYGLGKYGAGTYDLLPITGVDVYFSGSVSFAVNVGEEKSIIRELGLSGNVIVGVNFEGSLSRQVTFNGGFEIYVGITGNGYFGPPWQPNPIPVDPVDIWQPVHENVGVWEPIEAVSTEIWVPVTKPVIPARV